MSNQDRGESARSLRMATWLGWQIESNWADPLMFAIIDDREHYGMLKYMYAAPLNIYFYILGRGVAKTITGTVAVCITLLFGIAALGITFDVARIDWAFLVLSLILGLTGLAFLGILLGGLSLVTARHNYFVGEAVAGALYLLCGAVFPIDILPRVLQLFGQALPLTYWLEALRRALLGQGSSTLLASLSNEALLGILAGSTLALGFISMGFYRWAEHRAKEKGLIDMQTMY
ncbi:MAG: hypothetical protein A2Z21_01105 [Candidatus Fraserbacteria bacterium RBG_16_55_9]|uniref:ABC-2 type transporter transmembrane domain-containing protein n=1 Tax=Fraserbacteria sp. (strain RBG_16_55_9) TaxID=1817864 RepID=A0A1F5UQ32_FRAXR|nr:MAG: hypothetical protein A2Z21_01105 [Candidatus Fraserbacteria bacterium RBG_16_55_9]